MANIEERRFPVMGTTAHVLVVDGPAGLADSVEPRLHELEAKWSRFVPSSEISALRQNAGWPTIVSRETFGLVSAAVDAWADTDGLFDPTVGSTMVDAGYDRSFDLMNAGVSNGTGTNQPATTPQDVVLDPECYSVTVPAGVQLDLGGIGKGAAADLLAAELISGGAGGCCVNVGGDLRAQGRSPRPGGWLVSLGGQDQVTPIAVSISDGAVCTSTTTKRRWLSPAGQQHHLRNPATGAPAASGLATVSIICATATQGEVLAKVALLSGPEAGAELIAAAGATGLCISDDGRTTELDGLDRFIHRPQSVTVA